MEKAFQLVCFLKLGVVVGLTGLPQTYVLLVVWVLIAVAPFFCALLLNGFDMFRGKNVKANLYTYININICRVFYVVLLSGK